ncbi:MAG: isochorismate synthase [Bacteroidales bacterium]|nr:isochorismate synthase [Bacteroidales bacterium]
MIMNEALDYSAFDALIKQNKCFSVYKSPGEATIHFVMQQNGKPEYLQDLTTLNGKEGFVFAPFKVTDLTPVVLLHPDTILNGEKEILGFLPETSAKASAEMTPDINDGIDCKLNDRNAYQKAFELFHEALRSDYCEKIVLSRPYHFSKPIGFSAGKTFQTACKAYPEAFVYLFHSLKTGTWLGSSPELILSGKGENWQTVAMAGTKKISKKNETPDWDKKNIREQQIVAEYIEKQLYAHHLTCTIKGPFSCRAGKLMHLKTAICFRMIDNGKIGDLLNMLHPTPAVCGSPKEEAYRLITEKEGYDRSYYSGFIGKLSLSEKTGLFVNLRCMQIGAKILTLFAGGGLLTSSELEPEWEETEAKLQTMLSLMEK